MKKILFILFSVIVYHSALSITPIFTCGFECGVSGSATHIPTLGSDGSFSTSIVRSGSRSIRLNPAASTGGVVALPTTGASAVWIIRVYVYFASFPVGINTYIGGAGNGNGCWFKPSDSKLYSSIDGTNFSSTGVTVSTGQWYRLDIRYNNSISACDIQVDGTSTTSVSTTGSTPSNVQLGTSTSRTFDIYFDDVIFSNTTADFPIGAGNVFHFVPTADGSHSGLTASDFTRTLTGTDILNSTTDSYLLLDDVPLESGSSVDWINMAAPVASTYVENVFGPATGISTPTTAPRMVSVIIGIHAAGTGAYNAEWLLNDNGSTTAIFTASAVAGTTSVIYKTLNISDPPSAASIWTLSGNGNFNNVRVRFGPTASVDANPDVYFDCAMIEAEFQEVAAATPVRHMLPLMGVGMITPKFKPSNFIK